MHDLINYYTTTLGDSFRTHLLNWGELESLRESDLIEALVLWYQPIEPNVNISVCDKIILNCVKKTDFSWDSDSLSMYDKVYILKKLTKQGFDVLYANIIPYPSNTLEFSKVLVDPVPLDLITQFKTKFYLYHRTIQRILIIIAVVGGLYYFDHKLLIASLLFSYILWLLTMLHDHDSMTHRYLEPKNKVIDNVLKLACYVWGSYGATATNVFLSAPYNPSHLDHHRYWKDPIKDPYQRGMNAGFFKYFFVVPTLDENIESEKIITNLISYIKESYLLLLFCLALIVFGGWEIFFYFYVIPNIFVYIFPEILHMLQHKFAKSADEEFDFIWIMPIFGIMGNHITHHNNTTRQGLFGTKKYPWLKWFNIHYYIVKLLYNEKKI